MTPADIERAVAALRRAFPAVAEEGVERFRRELAPLPVWGISHDHGDGFAWDLRSRDGSMSMFARLETTYDGWRWIAWQGGAYPVGHKISGYAATHPQAMRAAERRLGLPECEVVNG